MIILLWYATQVTQIKWGVSALISAKVPAALATIAFAPSVQTLTQ